MGGRAASKSAVAGVCVLLAVACGSAGPTRTVTRSIELDNAESLAVTLNMGAGELHVSGGTPKLLDGNFRFNVPEWEPVVDYRNDGGRASLSIRQPSSRTSFRNTSNTWDLRLNDRVPTTIAVNVGAGQATFTLGSMDLAGVTLHEGAGEVTLDLRGTPKRSYNVSVDGGVGTARVRVPHSVGIIATAGGGIGGVNVSGLQKQGDAWVNPGHEHDAISIHLDVHGGVGEINISAD